MDEEEYNDIVDDITEEIETKYGHITAIAIPRPVSPEDQVSHPLDSYHVSNVLTLVLIVHNMRRYNKRALASLFVASSLGLQCSQDRMLLATHVKLLRFLAVRPAQPNTQPAAPETCLPESRGVYSASYIMLV